MEKPDPQRFSTEADFLFAWRDWEHEQEQKQKCVGCGKSLDKDGSCHHCVDSVCGDCGTELDEDKKCIKL